MDVDVDLNQDLELQIIVTAQSGLGPGVVLTPEAWIQSVKPSFAVPLSTSGNSYVGSVPTKQLGNLFPQLVVRIIIAGSTEPIKYKLSFMLVQTTSTVKINASGDDAREVYRMDLI